MIERDLDLLEPMARQGLLRVGISVTTLDAGVARRMEPRCPAPARRLAAIRRLSDAGIPVRAMVARGLATLKKSGGGSAGYAARAMVLVEPPSIDAGEITDKGYINQRLVLTRRADLVMRLHSEQPDEDVILLPAGKA